MTGILTGQLRKSREGWWDLQHTINAIISHFYLSLVLFITSDLYPLIFIFLYDKTINSSITLRNTFSRSHITRKVVGR